MRLRKSQEAVAHAICVDEESRDHAREVNAQRPIGTLAWASPRARRIKEEIRAAWSAREAVAHAVRIREISRSDARQIGCVGEGALEWACPGARHIKGGKSTIREAQEGMKYKVRIYI